MKKVITWALLLAMVLSVFAGCGTQEEAKPTEIQTPVATEAPVAADENLANAIAYLKTIYKNEGGLSPADFQRLGTIRVADVPYEVVYTVDCDESVVKVVKGEDGMVTIDVNEASDVEVPYVLTATITGTDGKTMSLTWNHVVPVSMAGRYDEIVDAGYALEDGESLSYEATLKGVITAIDTPYSDQYKNITVTIQVAGREDKPIMCYRLKGEGADALAVGDTITVTGTIKNYKGTIEFDAGCVLDEVISGGGSSKAPEDPAEIVAAAYELGVGESLPYTATLTGVIIDVPTGYNPKYGNVTIIIAVEGKRITCFRMKGEDEGIKSLHLNDTVTVTGVIKNYKGTIEFDAGCHMDELVRGTPPQGPKDPLEHIDAAYEAKPGYALGYTSTLTGNVVSVDTPYSTVYENVTVTIVVPGREDKPIQCFRLKGEGVDKVGVGDTITVHGWLMNYKGKVEFAASCYMQKFIDNPDPVAPATPAEIVDAAYALAEGEALPYNATLTGTVTKVNTAYSEQYKNVTVTIQVAGREDKPIECYRMKGETAATVKEGDVITVTGKLKNYKGKIEFDAGCTFTQVKRPTTPAEIVDAAYELAEGKALEGKYTLTGTVTKVNTAYSEQYKNVTVTIAVAGKEDKPIECFRMKGEGADVVKEGDVITVTGTLKNYKGKIEFDAGCTFISANAPEEEKPTPTTPAEIVDAAYALEKDETLGEFTLTGVITGIGTAYSEQYKNVTVTIVVAGKSDKPIECFRLKGEGADVIKPGDTVTVTGTIKNYNGKVQFDKATIVSFTATEEEKPALNTPAEIMAAAAALKDGESLDRPYTLSGVITEIDTPYSEQYKNVSVVISVNGTDATILCFRLKGDNAATIAVGDTITVNGTIKNYGGVIEFTNCNIV